MASQRAQMASLSDRVEFVCGDYSIVGGEFDKIVSVGMLEHVPRRAYKKYFKFIADRLHADGIGLIHCIGANAWINEHDPFIQKYVFPGANQPRLSEISSELERNSLPILDVVKYRPSLRTYSGALVRELLRQFPQAAQRQV